MALTLTGNVLSKISFCDKQCSNVNDNKFKSQIIQNLETKYNIQIVSRDYNILNPNILRNVSFNQHILTPYTHGNPYMLYLTKIDGINCVLFIDKKLKDGYTYPKMHCVKYRFSDDLYTKDTILTGELVRDNERRWFFLIDNILLYKGMSTADKNINSRFTLINSILENEYKQDKYLEICPLKIKKLFLYKDIKKMVTEFIPNLSYMCKGIVFYTLNNKHSNYAYLMPRDGQIEIKSSSEIDDLVQEKYPELWNKKHSITNNMPNMSNMSNMSDMPNEIMNNSLSVNNENNVSNYESTYASSFASTFTSNSSSLLDSNNNSNGNIKNDINKIEGNGNGNGNGNENVKIEIEQNNVVFQILKTEIPDIYNLYCIDEKRNLIKNSIALVPNLKISHYLYNTFKSNPNNLGLKVECKYSKIFEKWTPVRFIEHDTFKKNIVEEFEERLKNKE
jgi:hypothetical protein